MKVTHLKQGERNEEMNQEELWRELKSLPPDAQRAVADFIAFLRMRYKGPCSGDKSRTIELAEESFCGMWRNREDLEDSSKWVRNNRESEWDRNRMTKRHMTYLEKEDILHLSISDDPEAGSVEISPNITAELNEKGQLIGIEILDASAYLRDSILESVQAKMLRLSEAKTA